MVWPDFGSLMWTFLDKAEINHIVNESKAADPIPEPEIDLRPDEYTEDEKEHILNKSDFQVICVLIFLTLESDIFQHYF